MSKQQTIPSLQLVVPEEIDRHPGWTRLTDQISWYDRKSQFCQSRYKWLKVAQLLLAISIPILSFLTYDFSKWATGIAGGLIALIEGIQQLNQYSTNWLTYRSTAENLKHEQFLFLSSAGQYRAIDLDSRLCLLSERVEAIVSTEHARWIADRNKSMTSTQENQ